MNSKESGEIPGRPPRWVAIQRNPMSGSGRRASELDRLVAGLQRRGIRTQVFTDRAPLDAAIESAGSDDPPGLVAAGGDGTLLDVVNRHAALPIAVLPLGTENLFARSLGFVRDGERLAETIARGRSRLIDAALCNGRRFLIVASAGFDAEVIHRAQRRRTGRISRRFYVRPIVEALSCYRFPEIQVFADDDPKPLDGRLVIIANQAGYALQLPMVPGATASDGFLDLCIFRHRSWRGVCRDLFQVLMRRHPRQSHVTMRRVRRVRLMAQEGVPLQLDGDMAGELPAEIQVEPASLRVFVP